MIILLSIYIFGILFFWYIVNNDLKNEVSAIREVEKEQNLSKSDIETLMFYVILFWPLFLIYYLRSLYINKKGK